MRRPTPGECKKIKRRVAAAKDAHVRLYWYELESPAYRILSTEARALLIELRSLYSPRTGDNHVFCGVRRIMKRCNLSQRAASRARDELIRTGWIVVIQHGGFNCKVRHSTVFALENEAPCNSNGSSPRQTYMRWHPPLTTAASGAGEKRGRQIGYPTVRGSATDDGPECPKEASIVCKSTTDGPLFDTSSDRKSVV